MNMMTTEHLLPRHFQHNLISESGKHQTQLHLPVGVIVITPARGPSHGDGMPPSEWQVHSWSPLPYAVNQRLNLQSSNFAHLHPFPSILRLCNISLATGIAYIFNLCPQLSFTVLGHDAVLFA
jgi:hypothetical protein